MFIFSIIKSMLQFVRIGVHMLTAHPMIRVDNGAPQKAPDAVDAVGMNVSDNPFCRGGINPFVPCVSVFNSRIGRKFVGIDRFYVWRGVVVNELLQGRIIRMFNYPQPISPLRRRGAIGKDLNGAKNRDGRRRQENGYV